MSQHPDMPDWKRFDPTDPAVAALVSECRALRARSGAVAECCALLRARGLSKVESIVVLAQALGLSLDAAKRTVHFSAAWSDRRASDEQFHEDLERALRQVEAGEDSPEAPPGTCSDPGHVPGERS
jgi:hypothetical protein